MICESSENLWRRHLRTALRKSGYHLFSSWCTSPIKPLDRWRGQAFDGPTSSLDAGLLALDAM